MRHVPQPKSCKGFSLVDIMAGMVVGLLTMLVIMQTYAAFEGQKRTTINGMEALENGLISLHTLETDIKQAGYGMTANGFLACTGINTYNSTTTPTTPPTYPLTPLVITDGGTGSDTITATYSSSAIGGIPARIAVAMPDSSAIITVNTGNGFNVGDMMLLATPGSGLPCSRLAVTQIQTQANGVNLVHNPGTSIYNPPAASNIFPTGGYGTSPQSVVFNMGTMIQNQYQVLCNSLTATNLATATGAPACTTNPSTFTNTMPIAQNIVSIKAQYGISALPAGNQSVNCWTNATGNACSGTNWAAPLEADVARIKAIRVALVIRSSQMERPATAGGTCTATASTSAPNYPQWAGGAVNVTAIPNWQCYRYKVYQTIIPLRNILWANI